MHPAQHLHRHTAAFAGHGESTNGSLRCVGWGVKAGGSGAVWIQQVYDFLGGLDAICQAGNSNASTFALALHSIRCEAIQHETMGLLLDLHSDRGIRPTVAAFGGKRFAFASARSYLLGLLDMAATNSSSGTAGLFLRIVSDHPFFGLSGAGAKKACSRVSIAFDASMETKAFVRM